MNPYVTLFIAIAFEILATTALKVSNGLSKLVPSGIVAIGYGVSFWLMSLTLKVLPISIVYAIWAGVGILGIACIGIFYFGEQFGLWHIIGTLLIVSGVYILSLVTKVH
jgi:multidrug transporter EmrE-like cation transporter